MVDPERGYHTGGWEGIQAPPAGNKPGSSQSTYNKPPPSRPRDGSSFQRTEVKPEVSKLHIVMFVVDVTQPQVGAEAAAASGNKHTHTEHLG